MTSYLKEVKLLLTRNKSVVIPIVGKGLTVLFEIEYEEEIQVVRKKKKLRKVVKDQEMLVQVSKESVSILNVTRLDLTKNRDYQNEVVSEVCS